jgi:hypothetical protein
MGDFLAEDDFFWSNIANLALFEGFSSAVPAAS